MSSRSEAIAARQSVVSAATTMKSWRFSALSLGECSTKGPSSFDAATTAIATATATDSVAPCGPKRSAAQISAGKTR